MHQLKDGVTKMEIPLIRVLWLSYRKNCRVISMKKKHWKTDKKNFNEGEIEKAL